MTRCDPNTIFLFPLIYSVNPYFCKPPNFFSYEFNFNKIKMMIITVIITAALSNTHNNTDGRSESTQVLHILDTE